MQYDVDVSYANCKMKIFSYAFLKITVVQSNLIRWLITWPLQVLMDLRSEVFSTRFGFCNAMQ